jgi:hypothetical protein
MITADRAEEAANFLFGGVNPMEESNKRVITLKENICVNGNILLHKGSKIKIILSSKK